jgi:hypothetical protein
MGVIHAKGAGLDVHQKTVVACVRIETRGENRRRNTRRVASVGGPAGLTRVAPWGEGSDRGVLEAGVARVRGNV